MSYEIDLQIACKNELPVSNSCIISWVESTLQAHMPTAELTLRFVDNEEMHLLNHTYRKQDKTTNVLAFPSEIPDSIELEYPLLGDVIVCPDVLALESIEQNKTLDAHWAHIVIHGVLHLLGYDHIDEHDAKIMQNKEIELLARFNYANPYNEEDDHLE